jgi:HEPN domain-containing protein
MDKDSELRQWLEIAEKDLLLADFTAKKMWPTPYEMVCFHCQQAVEKYLKWFLALHDIDPPRIHNLIELEKLCEAIDPQFSMIYEKCGLLTGYGVVSRYPSDLEIEKEDMDHALRHAKSIREFFSVRYPDQFRNINTKDTEAQE